MRRPAPVGLPPEVHGLTEESREFLKVHNLLDVGKTLQQIDDTISDKPEKMVTYENAPRQDEI